MPALMMLVLSRSFSRLRRPGRHRAALIAAGMRAVVYCGSMGDWPLLTDGQRHEGVRRLVNAGVPVIVGTGAQTPILRPRMPLMRERLERRG